MITTWTQPTWGMSGPEFLWAYGTLCVAAGVWVGWQRLSAGSRAAINADPDLGIHELAMLSGGPQLAITSAATQLLRDGVVERGARDGALEVVGTLDASADPLERAVFESLEGPASGSVDAMRSAVEQSDALRTMRAELVDAGLLLEASEARPLRRHWLIGAALVAVGLLRIVASMGHGAPVGMLVVMVMAVGYATKRLFQERPVATRPGAQIVKHWRDSRGDLSRHSVSGESALTAALFGAGALWLAEPEIASALAVPRDLHWERAGDGRGSGSSGGCGGGGGGCGGCGGCG